jgi:uncharacterized protein YegP (UPF0339 family)
MATRQDDGRAGPVGLAGRAYERKDSALNGIESVKASAATAEIDDQTGE